MKALTVVGFLLLLVMSNVVAAGVFQVLGPLALEIENEDVQILAMCLIGVASIGAAVAFLSGSLRAVVEQLQCRAGRRGG